MVLISLYEGKNNPFQYFIGKFNLGEAKTTVSIKSIFHILSYVDCFENNSKSLN